jgi:hypothetical protein
MELNTASLSDLSSITPHLFLKAQESVDKAARSSGLFKIETIPANSGDSRDFTEIDLEQYASRKGEGDQADRASVQQGYSKTMTPYRIAKDIGITYEMRTRNRYSDVVARLTNLGTLADNRMELDLSLRLSFMASTSYTDKDGETVATTVGDTYQLAYSAHTLAGSSTQYRNILAGNPKISKGALEAIERLVVENTYNQLGEAVSDGTFDILWTTNDPNTVNTAREYLQSSAAVDGGNSGVKNVYAAKYRHVILPRIAMTAAGAPDTDKRYYWGIASSAMSSAYLGIWEEPHLKMPANLNAAEDFSTDDWEYGVRAGYGIVICGASWIKCSKGDGSA